MRGEAQGLSVRREVHRLPVSRNSSCTKRHYIPDPTACLSKGNRNGTEKKAFISYSHEDKDFVRRLSDSLNQNAVPLFFDEWDIRPGDSIVKKIFEEGLAKSDFFFIVLSTASVNSSWVRDELDIATI